MKAAPDEQREFAVLFADPEDIHRHTPLSGAKKLIVEVMADAVAIFLRVRDYGDEAAEEARSWIFDDWPDDPRMEWREPFTFRTACAVLRLDVEAGREHVLRLSEERRRRIVRRLT